MDSRDIWASTAPWHTHIDRKRMVAYVALTGDVADPDDDGSEEERLTEVPIRFEVCSLCGGKGSHVNPSIDSEGLTAEDFAEDPDFEESYRGGDYDVTCNRCGGERVVAVVDEERCDPTILKAVHDKQAANYEYACQSVHEREMGY
jgi:hypothetical protein